MNKIIYISLLAFLGLFFTQCAKDGEDVTVTKDAVTGGIVSVDNTNLNYVVGDGGSYSFNMNVAQNSDNAVSKVLVYKSAVIFNKTTEKNEVSNEILVETHDVSGDKAVGFASNTYGYTDLIDGLTVGGNALPTSDGELTIGDKFVFRIVSELANGNKHQQAYKVNMAVSTRFAGTYVVSGLKYFRIGVESPSYWEGDEVVVKSVDAITYEYDWGATIGWTGPLFFQVDAEGNVTYPEEWNGTAQALNGQPLITCSRNSNEMTNVPCEGVNIVIKDDVNGKDQLILTYGYLTAGSGPREFTETLTKK